ncbi:DNA cytosine methyltransferase [Paraburkholderia sp. Tr-20389]|uniref:DNA cytosine methyltransferase n=1 Tax=Paraburkholderia sp. Tr-20389 TaxID=2703903 RepID=UPI00198018DB|nr:DNA cytosine methyltransferase [Paraburkholderia sp. Tr-20389]MBN3757200.1 DNA cytosine methyltransferase [Paraburkholderia sp. Tr-20389]
MRFGSVCSGIEAASCAWHPLGWRADFLSEIEPFPSAVLAHHYPNVPNRGDMTKFKEWPDAAIDLLVGGTPCQSFSVAGLRKGLADPRGNLMLTYLAIAERFAPRWLCWENVPGVLSSNGGRDFGTFLAGLAELGYGFAYRVLDAQFFGVPQRRRRVFVVGYLGDWRPAAAVLFERQSLLGHSAPRREARKDAASGVIGGIDYEGNGHDCGEPTGPLLKGSPTGGGHQLPAVARALTTSNQRIDAETETLLVTHSLRGEGFDASEDGTGRGTPLIPVSYAIQAGATRENPESGPDGVGVQTDIAYTLEARAEVQSVAFAQNQRDEVRLMNVAGALAAEPGAKQQTYAMQGAAVRRLTPRECERLQGFEDDYTRIMVRGKPAADGPRYKALGNSMAVPVMRWIGERIQMVEQHSPYSQTNESEAA